MDILKGMHSLFRACFVASATMLTLASAYAQLVPGQLPAGPPPPPGVVDTSGKSSTPKQPTTTEPPSTFTPVSKEAAENAKKSDFVITTQRVLVPTTVYDPEKHGYVNGLKASDFEVLDNNKPQRVEAEITEQPLSVVLVVQANSDVEGMLPKIKKTGVLLQGLVTGSEGDLAVIAFDHEMHHILDFTSDPDKIDDAMQKIHAGSSTAAMIDATMDACHMLIRHDLNKQRRRVILLLSKNIDKGSQTHLDEAIHEMQFEGITVYSVNISRFVAAVTKGPDYPRPANAGIPDEGMPPLGGGNVRTGTTDVQQTYGENALNLAPPLYRSIRDIFKKTPAESLSIITGGSMYSFATLHGLEEAVSDIGKDLNSQYILSYAPTSAVMEEPGYHSIRVLVNQPGLKIRTRSGYWWGGGQMQ